MRKLVFGFLFMMSFSALAQECPTVTWSNASILRTALESKREELRDVKFLMVEAKKSYVAFVMEKDSATHKIPYTICGEEIEFGPIM